MKYPIDCRSRKSKAPAAYKANIMTGQRDVIEACFGLEESGLSGIACAHFSPTIFEGLCVGCTSVDWVDENGSRGKRNGGKADRKNGISSMAKRTAVQTAWRTAAALTLTTFRIAQASPPRTAARILALSRTLRRLAARRSFEVSHDDLFFRFSCATLRTNFSSSSLSIRLPSIIPVRSCSTDPAHKRSMTCLTARTATL